MSGERPDLVAFLRARLDEDEAAARQADGLSDEDSAAWYSTDEQGVAITAARMLREVEAKRKILAEHMPRKLGNRWGKTCPVCVTAREGYPEEWAGDEFPCATVRALAVIWSGHPDYDPAWATP